jgi:L-malate glycosyltransferase
MPRSMQSRTLLYLVGIVPNKMGCVEQFMRELALELHRRGWKLALCFEGPPVGLVREALDLPNVTLAVIPEQTHGGLHQAAQFFRLVAEHRPEVVVYSFNTILRAYPWIAHALSARRVFFNDHSSRQDEHLARERPRAKQLVARAIVAPIDGVICVSEFVRRCVLETGLVPPEKVHTVYNGVDLHARDDADAQALEFRARYRIPAGRKVVVQVSWLVAEKGVDKLLQAAKLVLASYADVCFVLVGDGAERAAYERLAAELGIADRVVWTGVVQRPTHEGVFAAADVCCQMSQWHEAFGATIAEAMSFGRPVVATRMGGIPELVHHEETGFVVAREDVADMAARILQLLTDDALCARLGGESRRVAEHQFDLSAIVARYLELLGIDDPSPVALGHRASERSPPLGFHVE